MATVSLEGLLLALDQYNLKYTDWEIHLYASSNPLVSADVLADFTAIESAFPGYALQALAAPTAAADDGSGNALSAFGVYTFTATGASGESAYGCYIEDTALGELVAAVEFTTPVDMSVNGYQCIVTLSDTMQPV